jgi:hypothetical protein
MTSALTRPTAPLPVLSRCGFLRSAGDRATLAPHERGGACAFGVVSRVVPRAEQLRFPAIQAEANFSSHAVFEFADSDGHISPPPASLTATLRFVKGAL